MKLIALLIASILCGVCGWLAAKREQARFWVLVILIVLVNAYIQRILGGGA